MTWLNWFEAVGITLGQSIGELRIQITLRTLHINRVFTWDTAEHVWAPSNGKLNSTRICFHGAKHKEGWYVLLKKGSVAYLISNLGKIQKVLGSGKYEIKGWTEG